MDQNIYFKIKNLITPQQSKLTIEVDSITEIISSIKELKVETQISNLKKHQKKLSDEIAKLSVRADDVVE